MGRKDKKKKKKHKPAPLVKTPFGAFVPSGTGGFVHPLLAPRRDPFALIRSDLPLHGCWITEDWQEHGMAGVLIARQMKNHNIIFAVFLVDLWGFGIKDCFGNVDFTEERFQREVLDKFQNRPEARYVACEHALARRLVLGGERWARQWQFKLPEEFKEWKKILEPLEPSETLDLSDFGKDGKPFLVGDIEDFARRMGPGWMEEE